MHRRDRMGYEDVKRCHETAFQYISKALEIEEEDGELPPHRSQEAVKLYKQGAECLQRGLNTPASSGERSVRKMERLKQKMRTNLDMTQERIAVLAKRKANEAINPVSQKTSCATGIGRLPSSARARPETEPLLRPKSATRAPPVSSNTRRTHRVPEKFAAPKSVKGVDEKLCHIILDQVLESDPDVTFDDIAGLDDAKRALSEIVILPALRPELFTGLRSPAQGLLLFGPPGNGKSLLAKAVAGEADARFFNISASSLTSKWVGEGEKLVKALFVMARAVQPSVIFIDEVDSILCERRDAENEASRRLKTEFLLQFDGVGSSCSDRVLIMAATNRPFELDDAVLRRFPKRIMIGLPDVQARVELLQKLLAKHDNPLSLPTLHRIARLTDGYSGSDLKNVAKDAAMGPIRELPPHLIKELRPEELRKITALDFEQSIQRIRPSTNPALIERLEQFNRDYGEHYR